MSVNPEPSNNDSSDDRAVLFAVLYGDVFNYAPSLEDLNRYLPLRTMDADSIRSSLERLESDGVIAQRDGFITLTGREDLAVRRAERASAQAALWEHVDAHLPGIVKMPWIQGAYITGSLAAGNADKHADIDLFLILRRGRVWLGYYLLRWIKRRNPSLKFCTNYIIADDELNLLDPNLYTAIEWAMSIPVKVSDVQRQFEDVNAWVREWLPNARTAEQRARPLSASGDGPGLYGLLMHIPGAGLMDYLLYRWVCCRSGGRYVPRRGTFKPHPPQRQYQVLACLLERFDQYNLVWPEVRDEIESTMKKLEAEVKQWSSPGECERSVLDELTS